MPNTINAAIGISIRFIIQINLITTDYIRKIKSLVDFLPFSFDKCIKNIDGLQKSECVSLYPSLQKF